MTAGPPEEEMGLESSLSIDHHSGMIREGSGSSVPPTSLSFSAVPRFPGVEPPEDRLLPDRVYSFFVPPTSHLGRGLLLFDSGNDSRLR